MPATLTTAPPVLPATGWKSYKRPHRTRLYLNAITGEGAREDATGVQIPPCLSLNELAEAVPADIEVVYLCGKLPEAPQAQSWGMYSGFNSWLIGGRDIEHARLDSGTNHEETFVLVRRANGSRLDIRTAAAWFGTNDLTAKQAAEAGIEVVNALRSQPKWGEVYLLDTPSRTGLDLWRATIGLSKGSPISYPVLDESLRELIRATEGQGRFELLPPSRETVDQIVYLDGRLRYGAMALMELGVGPARHDHDSFYLEHQPYLGYHPARYRICFTVPSGWEHLGLFMVKDGPSKRGRVSGGWSFPRTPGQSYETWADASELRVALGPFPHICSDCERCYTQNEGALCPTHGWPFTVLERIVYTKSRPLKPWARKLIDAREKVNSGLGRAAIRNILLHGIGALHGSTRPMTHIGSGNEAPDGVALNTLINPAGEELYTWEEKEQSTSPDCLHPELSSQIWDKARASLLLARDYDTKQFTGALTLPFDTVIAIRLDAIFATSDPKWPDRGRPGTMRVKGRVEGPVAWPVSEDDIAGLKVDQCLS